MIYLIKVEYKDVTLLKVGYAKNIKKRLNQYTTENPLFELLDYREGDRKLEEFLHSMFKEYKFEKGLEWFYYDDYIVNNFHSNFDESTLIEKIKKKMNKFKSFSSKLRLYCKFKEKYPEIDFIVERFQLYLEVLGFDRCKELGYKENLLYKELSNLGYFDNIKLSDEDDLILKDFLDNVFYKKNTFQDRMRCYCEFRDRYKDNSRIMEGLLHKVVDPKYHMYYNYFGTRGCSSRKYLESNLHEGLLEEINEDSLKNEIYSRFKEGDRVASFKIKQILGEVYKKFSISRTPKAKDLENYFKLTPTKITMPDKSLKPGFKLDKISL